VIEIVTCAATSARRVLAFARLILVTLGVTPLHDDGDGVGVGVATGDWSDGAGAAEAAGWLLEVAAETTKDVNTSRTPTVTNALAGIRRRERQASGRGSSHQKNSHPTTCTHTGNRRKPVHTLSEISLMLTAAPFEYVLCPDKENCDRNHARSQWRRSRTSTTLREGLAGLKARNWRRAVLELPIANPSRLVASRNFPLGKRSLPRAAAIPGALPYSATFERGLILALSDRQREGRGT
jgi:hypothetical protein